MRGLDKSSYNPGGLTSTPIVTLMTKLVDKEEMGAVMAMCSGVEQVFLPVTSTLSQLLMFLASF